MSGCRLLVCRLNGSLQLLILLLRLRVVLLELLLKRLDVILLLLHLILLLIELVLELLKLFFHRRTLRLGRMFFVSSLCSPSDPINKVEASKVNASIRATLLIILASYALPRRHRP